VFRAAAVRSHAGKQIGSNGDVAGGGELIGAVFDPVGHPEDLVNHEDYGRFGARFRIRNERGYGAVAMFDGDPLAAPRRFIDGGARPVLGEHGGSCEKQNQSWPHILLRAQRRPGWPPVRFPHFARTTATRVAACALSSLARTTATRVAACALSSLARTTATRVAACALPTLYL